jgi:hypothetical protein
VGASVDSWAGRGADGAGGREQISILAGDFLLSRASVLLSSLRNTEVVEIMALALEAIMKGQMQLIRPVDQEKSLETYLDNMSAPAPPLPRHATPRLALPPRPAASPTPTTRFATQTRARAVGCEQRRSKESVKGRAPPPRTRPRR